MKTAQQGDVLLVKVDKLPDNAILQKKGHIVVRHGESGHSHVIENGESFHVGDTLYLRLLEDATLTHEEHGPITLEPGIYEIGSVQEYDWLEQVQSPVID